MKKIFLAIIFFIIIFINYLITPEDNSQGFMVHGEDHIVSVILTKDWFVDMNYAHQAGVNAFFYLKDYTINNTPVFIVLNLAYKPKEESKLEEWIEYDIKSFLENYKEYKAVKLDWTIKSENNYKVVVYKFENSKSDIIQYSAYIDAGLKYFANIYIQIFTDLVKEDKFLDDFKNCLTKSHLSGIGIKYE